MFTHETSMYNELLSSEFCPRSFSKIKLMSASTSIQFVCYCIYSQVDFEVVLDNLKKLRENCKKSWEYLSVVAKHDSTKQLKSK